MLTTHLSNFRKNIKHYLDSVTKNLDAKIINRVKDTDDAVISLTERNSLTATQHEMSSKINEDRLDSAISKLRKSSSA